MGDQFKVAPYVVGQERQLKEGGVGIELGRGNAIQPIAFDLSDEVSHIGAAVIDGDGVVGGWVSVGAENPIGETVWLRPEYPELGLKKEKAELKMALPFEGCRQKRLTFLKLPSGEPENQ